MEFCRSWYLNKQKYYNLETQNTPNDFVLINKKNQYGLINVQCYLKRYG